MSGKRKKDLWRYTAGEKGVNRVTVYERRDSPVIQIEWWDDTGRNQKSLRTAIGEPVTDRDLAIKICERAAAAQKAKRNRRAAALLGLKESAGGGGHTLQELTDRLWAVRSPSWSQKYTQNQQTQRDFWLEKLGPETELLEITPAVVEGVVQQASAERGWSTRTQQAYLRFVVDAMHFARKKLRWIGEQDDLAGAVDLPKPKGRLPSYTTEEVVKLLDASKEMDPRLWAAAEIAFGTGRRVSAVLALAVDDVGEDGRTVRFDAETDKAGQHGLAVLPETAQEALQALLDEPAVLRTGYLFPNFLDPERADGPIGYRSALNWLREAEEAAGIPHVKRRGWHALKKAFATLVTDRRAASRQSGTLESTLQRHYENEVPGMREAVAEEIERARRQAEEAS